LIGWSQDIRWPHLLNFWRFSPMPDRRTDA
jgi:hypothetical protein